jgi:hypothetical protein
MAIAHDWLEPTDTQDHCETKFVDQLLEGWAKWARDTGIDQRPTPAGDLWQIQSIIEIGTYVLELNDASFVLIDQTIAALPARLKQIVFIEYMDQRPSRAKAKSIGLMHLAYRQRLHAAQWVLHAGLISYIDDLRRNATVNAVKNADRFRTKAVAKCALKG